MAGPPPWPVVVGADRGKPRPRHRRRPRRLPGPSGRRHLPDLHRPLHRHGELAAVAECRRVEEVGGGQATTQLTKR